MSAQRNGQHWPGSGPPSAPGSHGREGDTAARLREVHQQLAEQVRCLLTLLRLVDQESACLQRKLKGPQGIVAGTIDPEAIQSTIAGARVDAASSISPSVRRPVHALHRTW